MSRLYDKYTVIKNDGSPTDPDAKYFVLRIDTDSAARVALWAYIDSISIRDPEFAAQLIEWMGDNPLAAEHCVHQPSDTSDAYLPYHCPSCGGINVHKDWCPTTKTHRP